MAQIIVVGAGPAGCAVAATLAGSSNHQAILIESGRERPSSTESQRYWSLLGDPSRRTYRGGVGLGGSSLVNAGILGPVGVVEESIAPVSPVDPGPIGTRLLDASVESQRLCVLGANGFAISAAEALGIESSVATGGLTILAETTVESILFDGRRAVGVKTDRGALFGDFIVVATGAISTPVLLRDSGVDTPGIGAGLRDHPALVVSKGDPFGAGVRARSTALAPVPRPSAGDPIGHLLAIDAWAADEQPGPRSIDVRRADVETQGAVMIGLMTSRRVGSVGRSRETGGVIVDLGPSVDTAALARLWSRARQVLDSEALAPFVHDSFVDDWGTRFDRLTDDDAQIRAWVHRAATGYFHAAGTCARAVDPTGALLGYSGIVVGDLSAVSAPPTWPMAASLARGRAVARQLMMRLAP